MGKVGYTDVANQANTSDGFASGVGAQNIVGGTDFGLDVGDTGVVDLYGATQGITFTAQITLYLMFVYQQMNNS